MATKRDHPYSQFNFRVSWDGVNEKSVEAGFQEVSGLGLEMTIAEYRAGNHSENSSLKVNGTNKVPDIRLNNVRNGAANQFKTVTIKLMAEDRETEAVRWKLMNARPMKYTGPALNGKGTDLAIEELVLASERIELELR